MNTSSNTKAPVIYIEIHGGIGQGKSYTLNHIQSIIEKCDFKRFCDYYFISEPINLISPLLTKYYKNNTHALALQACCFMYYFQELNKLHCKFESNTQDSQSTKPKIVFLDRSLTAGKHIFLPILEAVGAIQELEASVLQSLADELLDVLNIPEENIYRFALIGPAKQGQKNMHFRGRRGEEKLSLNYLQQISERHYNWASLLDSQIKSKKMIFCQSQNEMLMQIVKIMGRQHPIPAKINWYIASKRPSDIWSNILPQVEKINMPAQANLAEKSSKFHPCSGPAAKMTTQDDADPTSSINQLSFQADSTTKESYDEVD